MITIAALVLSEDQQSMTALDETGASIPVTNWIDADGDETDDWKDAVSAVAGPDQNGMWHRLNFVIDTSKPH